MVLKGEVFKNSPVKEKNDNKKKNLHKWEQKKSGKT